MWKIAGAMVSGTSHQKANIPCQDFIQSLTKNGVSCIALADGAGSYKFSDIGAEIACKAVCEYLTTVFDEFSTISSAEIKRFIIHGIRTRLGRRASILNTTKGELSSTLLFAAIKGDKFIIGHLGDGVICGCYNNGELVLLSGPENGEFANTTYFVTSRNYATHFRIYRGEISDLSTVYLMSDGSAEALFHKTSHNLSSVLKTFGEWIDNHSPKDVGVAIESNIKAYFPKHTTDDCSIIIMRKTSVGARLHTYKTT